MTPKRNSLPERVNITEGLAFAARVSKHNPNYSLDDNLHTIEWQSRESWQYLLRTIQRLANILHQPVAFEGWDKVEWDSVTAMSGAAKLGTLLENGMKAAMMAEACARTMRAHPVASPLWDRPRFRVVLVGDTVNLPQLPAITN